MAPTHIKSLTHHSYQLSMGGWVHIAGMLWAYSKANSPVLRFKEAGQPPAPRTRGRERKEMGVEVGIAVEEWHHLPWNVTIISSFSLAFKRGDIILSLPLPLVFSSRLCGEGVCLFVCRKAFSREIQAEVDVCLHSFFHTLILTKKAKPASLTFVLPHSVFIMSHLRI